MSTLTTYKKRIKLSLRGCTFKPSLRLDLFEEEYCLDFFGFLIALPFLDRFHYDPYEIMESWGIYYHEAAIVLCWGRKTKFIHMPWQFRWIKTDVQRPDGTWVKEVNSYDNGEPDGRWIGKYPYRYILQSGEIQNRTATIHVNRMEWRQRWLKWCPLFAKVRTYIDIDFNDEVGERTGSWKGGCLGCSYELRKGESPEECLRRMERERKF